MNVPEIHGDRWRGGITVRTDPETGETATISVEQSGVGGSRGNLVISTTNLVVSLVDVDEKDFDRVSVFFAEAAQMLRQCSNEST